jgi:hypothetical protein
MKGNSISFLHKNVFLFGGRPITQYVIFEWKRLFSVIIFNFHKTEKKQDRFHTHAFNALSIKLMGSYEEHILLNESSFDYKTEKRTQIFKYFPRDVFHRIGRGDECWTLLISGPWNPSWREKLDSVKIVEYKWNRKKII